MNKFAFVAALAASLCGFAATSASAQDVAIPYSALDVSTPAGAQALAERFAAGVDTACARPDIRDIKAMADFTACKDAAVISATQQLNNAGALLGAKEIVAQG